MAKFTQFHLPPPPYLQALGAVAVHHAHLDRMLQMAIKTLAEVTPQVAIDATEFQGSAILRERILTLARKGWGEGQPLIRLQALMRRCAVLTDRRNDWTHSICGKEEDGEPTLVRGT